MDGKLTDVIIEEERFTDRTGLLLPCRSLVVYADPGMKEIINSVPGVASVFCIFATYHVYIDPRYDLEWLKAEIEARIKIGELPNG